MKRIIIALTLLVMTFNTFALEKSENMEDSLQDKTELETEELKTEEVEKGFDWLVIPEIDTTEPELPNNDYYDEMEKKTVDFIFSLFGKVESLLQSPQN